MSDAHQSPFDVVILGAGMSGLAAGIRLAHFGKRVCILERHTTIGGLNSFYRLRGRNYDVGLHAVTNFAPKGAKRGPLSRLLRQLRFSWDELELVPQRQSRIAFGERSLAFSNDPQQLETEIATHFPAEIDNYRRLVAEQPDYDVAFDAAWQYSAREALQSRFANPLLVEMLLCPVMFYGSASEHDLPFGTFAILFRSMFLEGLARPASGIRLILKLLTRRYRELGGELWLRKGVRRIVVDGRRVEGVELDDGTPLQARQVLSSAGWPETLQLAGVEEDATASQAAGRLSFVESISILDVQPDELGLTDTMVFYNGSSQFNYRRPEEQIDASSGVICVPNNFDYAAAPGEGSIRLTVLANYDRFATLGEAEYRAAKEACYEQMCAAAVRYVPDFRPHVVEIDTFTPTTIRRFTGRAAGAVYGSAEKRFDGTTPWENLFLCGTDQGLVGIIGAITSGITMANRHLLSVS